MADFFMENRKLQEFEDERLRVTGESVDGEEISENRFIHSTQSRVASASTMIKAFYNVSSRESVSVVKDRLIMANQHIIRCAEVDIARLRLLSALPEEK